MDDRFFKAYLAHQLKEVEQQIEVLEQQKRDILRLQSQDEAYDQRSSYSDELIADEQTEHDIGRLLIKLGAKEAHTSFLYMLEAIALLVQKPRILCSKENWIMRKICNPIAERHTIGGLGVYNAITRGVRGVLLHRSPTALLAEIYRGIGLSIPGTKAHTHPPRPSRHHIPQGH